MLNQFRQLYPQGTIFSELINIDRGLYVVKVSLQDRNIILGTGFAAAETIEKAEDRARERALMTVNLSSNQAQIQQPQVNTPSTEIAAKSAPNVTLPPTPQAAILGNTEKPLIQTPPEVSSYNAATKTSPIEKAIDNHVATAQQIAESEIPKPVSKPEPIEDILPPSVAETPLEEEAQTNIFEQPLTPPPEEESPSSIFEPTPTPPPEEAQTNIFEQPLTSPEEENPTNIFEQPLTSPEEITEDAPEEATETIQFDFNDIKHKTDLEMKRLGWTKEQGRDYLLSTYGKRSRLHLTDEELLEFWRYLETLPN